MGNILVDSDDNYNVNDLCIYIDPIDSTTQFMNKNYQPVTTLIGITFKNKPFVGFILFPETSQIYYNIPGKGIYEHSNGVKLEPSNSDKINFLSSKEKSKKSERNYC
jgi:fructose-1,6-bisphosphatase/inositol monophosphatase family enzyme